jgi:mandelate racemase
MKLPLGTSAATVRSAPLLLIDLETEEGITGRTYLFCYMPLGAQLIARVLQDLLSRIKGDAVDPAELGAKLLPQFRLIGAQGVIWMAMAGLNVACWDALARRENTSLAVLNITDLPPVIYAFGAPPDLVPIADHRVRCKA